MHVKAKTLKWEGEKKERVFVQGFIEHLIGGGKKDPGWEKSRSKTRCGLFFFWFDERGWGRCGVLGLPCWMMNMWYVFGNGWKGKGKGKGRGGRGAEKGNIHC